MSKHTIEVEGLPEGWEPVAYRIPLKDEYILMEGMLMQSDGKGTIERLIVQPSKPRRIVLEETEGDRQCNSKNTINYDGTLVHVWGEKIWREVKEE